MTDHDPFDPFATHPNPTHPNPTRPHSIAETGAALLLPAPRDDGTGRLRWILQPRDMFRPAMDTVLTALDDVLKARAGKRNFPDHATATSICE
ncbi:hypothetical protein [Nocardia nova]|nr:hypothetical protein [Nocardia nova]